MADAPVVLTTKQITALAQIKRQEENLERIKLTNTQLYQEKAADIDLTPVPPERRTAFVLTENFRPYLKIGEYVKVERKTGAGYNRIEGYGYIWGRYSGILYRQVQSSLRWRASSQDGQSGRSDPMLFI